MLGWDITDFGLGDFDRAGFGLITIRNGNQHQQDKYPKPYAEKLLFMRDNMYAPMHFHWNKMEDIIYSRVYKQGRRNTADRGV